MICYKDRCFCSKRDCPNMECDKNPQTIPWYKLPNWMCVAFRDCAGQFEWCPKEEKDG